MASMGPDRMTLRAARCGALLACLIAVPVAHAVVRDGSGGPDHLTGTNMRDLLRGGQGADQMDGATGSDKLDGGAGNDVITAVAGGRDKIDCGPGNDRARVIMDRTDTASNCEQRG